MTSDEDNGDDARSRARAVATPQADRPAFQSTTEAKAERLRRVRLYAGMAWRGRPIDFDEPEKRRDDGLQECVSCGGEVDVAGGDLRDPTKCSVGADGWRCEGCAAGKRRRA